MVLLRTTHLIRKMNPIEFQILYTHEREPLVEPQSISECILTALLWSNLQTLTSEKRTMRNTQTYRDISLEKCCWIQNYSSAIVPTRNWAKLSCCIKQPPVFISLSIFNICVRISKMSGSLRRLTRRLIQLSVIWITLPRVSPISIGKK